jgi:hypothetical protein
MNVIEVNQVKKDYPLGKTTVHALRGAYRAVGQRQDDSAEYYRLYRHTDCR